MNKAILGKKIGMTQIFLADGRLVPVTVVEAGPCVVTQIKTKATDGYEAVQVGFGELAEERAKKLKNKPELGHFAKAGVSATRYLRELRLDDITPYQVGQSIKCDVFAEGDKIDVSGISKGHGYTGPIQRWNMHTGPMGHGSKYPSRRWFPERQLRSLPRLQEQAHGLASMVPKRSPSRILKWFASTLSAICS